MNAPRPISDGALSAALGLDRQTARAPSPRPGTRAWYAALVAFDLADTLRSLRLPCAARLCVATAPAEDWRDVATELRAVTVSEMRVHEARAAERAAAFMSTGEPIGAADALQHCRGCDTLTQWGDEVRAEMLTAGVRL